MSDNNATDCQLLENQLCHRFYVISNAITRAYRPMLDKLNLTYPQYVVMMALWEKDDITISELQQKTQIDIGCLSLMLKKMCNKKLMYLIASDTDRRSKKVKLTEEGINIKAIAKKGQQVLECDNPLSEEEIQTLLSLLNKLRGH